MSQKKDTFLKASDFLLIYCPVPDQKTGETLSHRLLSQKLIACANLCPPGSSFYQWQGEIQNSVELILICKTKKSLYLKVEKQIQKHHPYKCPSIIAISFFKAYQPFLKWIEDCL